LRAAVLQTLQVLFHSRAVVLLEVVEKHVSGPTRIRERLVIAPKKGM
jgi:hypothetical protein